MISLGRCFRGRNPGVAAHLRERMGVAAVRRKARQRRRDPAFALHPSSTRMVWLDRILPQACLGKMLCCIQRVLRVPNGSIREASSRADSLSSCWLELPHLGETMHEGHPASQRHSANLDAVVCHHCSARS